MTHFVYKESDKYRVALLIKPVALNMKEVSVYYVTPMAVHGVKDDEVVVFPLSYDALGKATSKFIKDTLDSLLSTLHSMGVDHLYVTDSSYFKVLTKETKAEPHYGYAMPCKLTGYEHMTVVLGVNYQALIHNPSLQHRLDLSIKALSHSMLNSYVALGSDVVHSASYPTSLADIEAALADLHQYPYLTCDIEAFSLRFNEAGIGSVAFAWNQNNGLAFLCDYQPCEVKPEEGYHGVHAVNSRVRKLLFIFFSTYRGAIVWHNAAYDVKVIIYTLWMKDGLDTSGLLDGLDVMTRDFHDTKIVAYLATNSTAGNNLKLKHLAHAFAGNWANPAIKDIRKIAPADLLRYNLIDALSTMYVKETYGPIMVADNQLELYEGLMLSSLVTIIQMELTGMPINLDRVQEVKLEMTGLEQDCLATIHNSPCTKGANLLLQEGAWKKDFEERKAKAKNPDKIKPKEKSAFDGSVFNPNSGHQLQVLLYEFMGLPVLDLTDTKQSATGGETLEKLINHTTNPDYKDVLSALIGYSQVNKILTSFIPAFERAVVKGDGWAYLHGSFNLGGTLSGRLSSSDPNLQNIPAGNTGSEAKKLYGKFIKSCFEAPSGFLFAGADFSSLEDYISALTTKDQNKLRVYTDGYDGHSLRAFKYFGDQMPDIVDTVESINSIGKKYPGLRQESKPATFLLTYGGTYHGMMENLGWSKEKSQAIEKNYHGMYKVSDEYVQARLKQASKDGFVEVAFGLRVRTPMLSQVIFGAPKMPYEAAAEGRTAGNALGQSYGLLNNRAANAFMEKARKSPYRLDIKLVAMIHDALYLLVRDDPAVVEWVNKHLIEEMQWQDLPELAHPTVKLGAALDLFWPTWANAITIPNGADQIKIMETCISGKAKYLKEKETNP